MSEQENKEFAIRSIRNSLVDAEDALLRAKKFYASKTVIEGYQKLVNRYLESLEWLESK